MNDQINTEFGTARGDVTVHQQNLARPLWVIAICSAILTFITVIVLGYAGVKYIQLRVALNELSQEWNSETTAAPIDPNDYEPCDPQHPDNC